MGAHARKRRQDRGVPYLPEATRWNRDRELRNAVYLVRTLKAQPQIYDPLVRELTIRYKLGRHRGEGCWADVALGMVAAGEAWIQTYWAESGSGPDSIWGVAGFPGNEPPSYEITRLRLIELERLENDALDIELELRALLPDDVKPGDPAWDDFLAERPVGAFRALGDTLVAQAKRHEPRVGLHADIDGTLAPTGARLHHNCKDKKACRAAGGRPARNLPRSVESELLEEVHRLQREDPETAELSAPPAEDLGVRKRRRKTARGAVTQNVRWYRLNGHDYFTLDTTSGCRRYTNNRFVHGANIPQVTDSFVGAALSILPIPASDQEYAPFAMLLDHVRDATGDYLDAAVGDRLYGMRRLHEQALARDVDLVHPFRKPNASVKTRYDLQTDKVDAHGNPRCHHCTGPGDRDSAGMGLYFDQGRPYIRFRCQLGLFPECRAGSQTLACSTEWLLMGKLSRLRPLYHALRARHQSAERVHYLNRIRYNIGPKGIEGIPRRNGIPWLRFRALVARALDWLRICLRNGWLGSHRTRNAKQPRLYNAQARLERVLASRRAHDLDIPLTIPARLNADARGSP
jgi:hypothetical protein